MLLAEELVLLLLDDDSGRWLVRRPAVRAAVRVALVVELLARRTVALDDDGEVLVAGLSGTTGGDVLLDRTAAQVAGQPLKKALEPAKAELPELLRRLRGRGVLRRALLRRHRHLARDAHQESAVRARLLEVLTVHLRPDRHTALLVALVFELRLLPTLFPDQDGPALTERAANITFDLRKDLHYFPTTLDEEVRASGRTDAGDVLSGIGDALEALDAVGDLLTLVSLPVRLAIRVLDGWP